MEFKDQEHKDEIRINFHQEMNSLIPKPTGWLLYSGISSIALSCLLGLMISWWIKYPDVIIAEAEISTKIPALDQFSNTSEKIDILFVKDGDTVELNKRLIILKSDARWEDIDSTYEKLKTITSISQDQDFLIIQFPKNMVLGSIQNKYEECSKSLIELQNLLLDSLTNLKIASINSEIGILKQLIRSNKNELDIFNKEFALVNKETNRNSILMEEGVISPSESEKYIQKSLQSERQRESMKSIVFGLEGQIINLQKQTIELIQARGKEIIEKKLYFKQTNIALMTAINEWKHKFEILAGANGIISFPTPFFINQQIRNDQILLSIIPMESNNPIIAICKLEGAGYGKVIPGQKVIIEINNYPAKEYGSLTGKILKTAILPQMNQDNKKVYSVEISLGDSLITDYGKRIPFQHKMNSRAKIITKEKRLVFRIFENIRNLIKQ